MKKGILFLLSMTLLCADFAYSQVENAQNQADSNITLLDKKAQKNIRKNSKRSTAKKQATPSISFRKHGIKSSRRR